MIIRRRPAANNLEAKARALAERALRGSYLGNPKRHAEMARLCEPANIIMPKLLSEEDILREVERDWPLYAEIIVEAESA